MSNAERKDQVSGDALPERVWILTHPAWRDDATRQTYEVIRSADTARGYMLGMVDPNVADSFRGFQIAEYRIVRGTE